MADIYVFENNAGSTLLTGIGSGDTQLTVAAGEGVRFPAPGAGEIAALTLVDSILGLLEIVTLTVRAGDLMTIVRGQEGTTPLAFSAGTTVSHRVTKGTLEWLQGLSAGPAGGFVLLSPAAANEQTITPGDAADIVLGIQGIIGQTGNLQEWRNSAAAIKVSIAPDGALTSVERIQGQRLKSIIAGDETTPSIQMGGDSHGFRLFGDRFAVVVSNKDSAVFEGELVAVGSLDNLSILTKRLGDLLYFPLGGGVLQGALKLEDSDPFLDLADADAPAFPGFNRIRFLNEMQAFTIELRSNAESLLANILKFPYDVNGATAIESYIAGTLAATVSVTGASSPSAKTVITREKGDARFAPVAHLSDTGDPHDVQAVQVDYSGALGSTVQQALDALEAVPPGGVQTVFGRSGAVVAGLADYQAFYLDLAGGTLTGALDLVGGATGSEAASADDVNITANAKVASHAALGNPHADSLADGDLASQAEAEAGTNNTKWMSPLRTEQAIAEFTPVGWELVSTFYDFGTDGVLASAETPTFVDGFEYRVDIENISHNDSSAQGFQMEVFKATASAYDTQVRSSGVALLSTNTAEGRVNMPDVRESITLHALEGVFMNTTLSVAFTFAGAWTMTAQKIDKVRFSYSAGSLDGGKLRLYKKAL